MVLLPDSLDNTLLLEVTDGHSRHGAIDLQAFAHHSWSDQFGLWDLFQELVICGLVKHHQVCELLFDLALAPFLLLGATTSHGSLHLRLLGLLHHFVGPHGCYSASTTFRKASLICTPEPKW